MSSNRLQFTGKALRALPSPAEGWAYYHDESTKGLSLGVGSSGAKSFVVYRKFKGRPVRITLGVFDPALPETREWPDGAAPLDLLGRRPSLNVRMAQKLATAVQAKLDVGINPAEQKREQLQEELGELTLGELFRRYKSYLITERRKTLRNIVWFWERYLGEVPDEPAKKHGHKRTKAEGSANWERRRLSTIKRSDVALLRANLAEHVGRTAANNVMTLLHAIYNYGIDQEFFDGPNPVAPLKKFKFKLESRKRRIESHEARQFFAALDAEDDIDFRDYVLLSIYTGARRGNVLAMRWDELNLSGDNPCWAISGELMKNGEPVMIPLIPEAVEILRRRFGTRERLVADGDVIDMKKAVENAFVFPGNTPAGHAGPFRARWAKFITKAEVPKLRIHDLRRTLGTWMANTGANTVLTMAALGHKTTTAALIYQRWELRPVQNAMEAGVRGLLKAAEPKAKSKTRSRARTARAGR